MSNMEAILDTFKRANGRWPWIYSRFEEDEAAETPSGHRDCTQPYFRRYAGAAGTAKK
jgi:hypothetical protein